MKKTIIYFLFLVSLQGMGQTAVEPIVSRGFYIPTESVLYLRLGSGQVPVQVIRYGDRSDLVCINVHDNERTSVEAAKSILQYSGGILIRIDNRGQRVLRFRFRGQSFAVDPNRIFSREGIEQSLRENCGRFNSYVIDEIESFASQLLGLLPDSALILALHNNTNEAFSVKSYLPRGDREKDARQISCQENQDPDDIIITTDEALFHIMSRLGYNAIWQDNEGAKKDGSLSIWSGERGRRYINIETEHGKLQQYIEMMGRLLEELEKKEVGAVSTQE